MQIVGNCKDCQFWRRGRGFDVSNVSDRVGQCFRFQDSQSKMPNDEIARPSVSAGGHGEGNFDNGVITGPLFGCIKFETRR